MNRLNPLYIIALFATLLFVSFYLLKNEVSDFNDKNRSFNELQIKAKEFKEYKSYWNNERYINKELDNILNNSKFKNAKVLKAKVKNVLKIKVQSFDSSVLNSFLNRVLNKKFIIKKLELNKEFINLEIGLK